MSARQFFRWCLSSLWGHLVYFGILWGVGFSILGLWLNWTQGTLTLEWAFYVVGYSFLGGPIVGALVWYLITRPRFGRLLRAKNASRLRGIRRCGRLTIGWSGRDP